MGTLTGRTIAVTAARKADEQAALLERRGANVVRAPAVARSADAVDDGTLRRTTDDVLSAPVDLFLATTGVGLRGWFAAARAWGVLDRLLEVLGTAQVVARGPKSVGALHAHGLREAWAPASEAFDDVLDHLRDRDLRGVRVVLQEHGQEQSAAAEALRARGADVVSVAIYRVGTIEDDDERAPLLALVDAVAAREVDAVTFTSAPAVTAFLEAATEAGRGADVEAALADDVVAACVGPVTAAPFDGTAVRAVWPERMRLAAMVRRLEDELATRRPAP